MTLEPSEWPVLVTGAGGFVGGHVARHLAGLGHPVIGLARRDPITRPFDPATIAWQIGDLRDPEVRRRALAGVRGVVHSAGWVSLAADPKGEARAINVDATRALLEDASAAGVERFVHTSTLHTLAAGTAEHPANEDTPWNLGAVDSPYARTKREAEAIVLGGTDRLAGVVLCPGMVIGPRDTKPTSTRLLLALSRRRTTAVPPGGIPLVDTGVVARAHRGAIERGEPGRRYAVVGPYKSYPELARMVGMITSRPSRVYTFPEGFRGVARGVAGLIDAMARGRLIDISRASVSGGFLRLHVDGSRANALFELVHPSPLNSIHAALDDASRFGRAPWIKRLRAPG